MEQMIVSLTPVFMILAVGFLTRRLGILGAPAINGLKSILIKIALPGALFMAFAAADMRVENIWIFSAIFIFCVVLYLLGGLLHRFIPGVFPDEYTNGYFTGFEFGMIGIGLFTAIWGMERLPTIAMIAFGHEIFIWFVYVPILESRKTGKINAGKILKDFFRTPTVIAILLGVLVNITGVYPAFSSVVFGVAVLNCLKMLTGLVAPLILLIVGHSLTFKKIPLKKSVTLLTTRWSVVLGLGYALNTVLNRLIVLDAFFSVAFYALILLPPPFILPLFMKREQDKEISFFSELLIYYTVLSFIGYVVFMSMLT